jgi:hypothetical protein
VFLCCLSLNGGLVQTSHVGGPRTAAHLGAGPGSWDSAWLWAAFFVLREGLRPVLPDARPGLDLSGLFPVPSICTAFLSLSLFLKLQQLSMLIFKIFLKVDGKNCSLSCCEED